MSRTGNTLPFVAGLLPAVSTVLGLLLLDEALISVMLYHAGIVYVMIRKEFQLERVWTGFRFKPFLWMSVLCFLTFPLLYLLWPWMVLPGVALADLLVSWRIVGNSAWVFVIYSITLHPFLEESFWRGLMPDHWLSDALFAGFHLLVLATLVHPVWLPLAFLSLCMASAIWRGMVRKTGGLLLPVLTHALADLGVVLAVILLLRQE